MNFENFLAVTSVCKRHKDKCSQGNNYVHKGKNIQVLQGRNIHLEDYYVLRCETMVFLFFFF